MTVATAKVLHIRTKGVSQNIPLSELDCNLDSDEEIKKAAASFLKLEENALQDHELVRHKNENITIHPQAVFG